MHIAFFSTQPYDRQYFDRENLDHIISYFEVALTPQTAALAKGSEAVCAFVNDKLNAATLQILADGGVRLIALRSAGFNHVDLEAADRLKLTIVRVPAYSPYAVAEHAVALLLTLNRKTHKAYNRVREGNFSLDRLVGFDLHGKTIGVVGTGKIGEVFCHIMLGFGCKVLAFDLLVNKQLEAAGVEYLPLLDLLAQADVVSLHCPLNEQTKHIISKITLDAMKPGALLLNTSRGGLVNTPDTIAALRSGQLGGLGMDVYEQEEKLFFFDRSEELIGDTDLMLLLAFPNVLVTAHQAFFTEEALTQIARITLGNVTAFANGKATNEIKWQ